MAETVARPFVRACLAISIQSPRVLRPVTSDQSDQPKQNPRPVQGIIFICIVFFFFNKPFYCGVKNFKKYFVHQLFDSRTIQYYYSRGFESKSCLARLLSKSPNQPVRFARPRAITRYHHRD